MTNPAIDQPRNRPSPLLWSIPLAWIAAVVAVAAQDGFVADATLPPWPTILAVFIPLSIFGVGLGSQPVRHALVATDPSVWLAVQLWRVVGAAFLFGWAGGELDTEFAIPAGVGDIATGVAALWLLILIIGDAPGSRSRGDRSLKKGHVVAFTALGMGDFAVAVLTGVLVRPDGLETLPWILFPTLAVPFFTVVHIINWIQLTRLADSASPTIRP